MSLDWNTSECPYDGITSGWIPVPQEDLTPGTESEKRCHPVTNSLVWGAFCGFHVGTITPKTIDEIIWRIEFLKKIDKPWMADKKFPTPVQLDSHLGFRTNCDTKTRKQWLAFITRCLSDDVDRIIKNMYTSDEHVEAVNM